MNNGETSIRKSYSFSKSEYEKILELFSVLQRDISSACYLPDKTRSRLYEKLEEMILYSEMMVDKMDVFWAFIARAEIAYKVYEKNKIPDSLIELTTTIWLVQCRTEGRPLNAVPPILF